MKILGISAVSKFVSIGLIEDEHILADFGSSRVNSEELVVLLERILSEAGVDIKEIEGISVAQGPGSYTGLRGGLAAAKSFSQTLDIPIVGVSSLEAMAFNLKDVKGTIVSVLDAVRGEANVALFTSDSKNLKRIMPDIVVKEDRIKELLSQIQGEIYVVSNVAAIKETRADNVIFVDGAHCYPFGINVARLGLDKIKAGEKDDYLTITPNYSHMPNIREFG